LKDSAAELAGATDAGGIGVSSLRGRLGTIGQVALAASVLLPVLVALQLVGTVQLIEALLTSTVVAVQTLGGSLLWVWVKRQRTMSWIETIALGIPLGAVVGLLAYQLFLKTPLQPVGWLAPTGLIVLGYLLTSANHTRIRYPSWPDTFGLGVIGLSALVLAGRVWFTTPLRRDGWFALFGDIPIHEAMANTLALRGPSESLMLLGGNLRYHWFADAWAGTLTEVTGAEPYVALTRTLFSVAIVGGALLAWTLAPLFIKGRWARVGAGLTLFLGTTVVAGFGNPGSPVLEKFSPTITFGALCLLAVSYVILSNIRERTSWASLVGVVILGIGVVGGRITLGAVAVGGAAALMVLALVLRRQRLTTLINLGALGTGFLLAFILLTSQEPIATQVNPWVIQPNIDAALLWSLIPFYNPVGYIAAVIAVIAVVSAQASGVLWSFMAPDGVRNPANYWVMGILIFGFLGVFLTQQLGYAQMTFLGSAIIPVLVASGAGLGGALENLRGQLTNVRRGVVSGAIGVLVVLLLALGTLAATPLLIGFRYFGPTQWALPFAVWIVAFVLGYLLLKGASLATTRRNVTAAGISMLVATTLATPVWQIAQQIRVDAGVFTTANANIVTMEDFEAADWIQRNTPVDSVWATNRMCSVVGEIPPECPSTNYVLSSLAKRQALIEGYSYSIGGDIIERADEFSWAIDRIMNSYDFGRVPSTENAQYLWDQGVRYFWVDRAVVNAGDWEPYGRPIFENSRAVVLELTDPSLWSN
jgi:hypothetical protein